MHLRTTFSILPFAIAVALAYPRPVWPQDPAATHAQEASGNAEAFQLQVMLDRAGFSPGVIDGRMGSNTNKALIAFQKNGHEGLPAVTAIATYRITEADAAGPFIEQMPTDMMELAGLGAIGYSSLVEALAERFHTTPALLQQLNPGMTFAAGQEIQVPNVEPMALPASAPAATSPTSNSQSAAAETPAANANTAPAADPSHQKPDVTVTVRRSASALSVTDATGRIIFYAPVTTGSEHDPLPIGDWKVTGVQLDPKFRYNPDLFWDADPSHTKAVIPPGPNNPVGVVWIDITKPHYGLHGTPEPASVGKTQSHGCVRLTNWDALRLASLVKPGTRVVFTQ